MADGELMGRAISLARLGLEEGEVPIAALVALDGEVVTEAYWRGEQEPGVLRHPELVALLEADRVVGPRRREAALYTTLEPCLMCMGTAMSFFIGRVVYALDSATDGAARIAEQWAPPAGHPRRGGPYGVPSVTSGVCADEVKALVAEYLASGATGPLARFAATLV